ncbi:hypothetical protein CBS101457_005843 [Exobasidium rhododendri]|nr:hypothetical protein CBS101457_005843 [Exobasidium rhododendri]
MPLPGDPIQKQVHEAPSFFSRAEEAAAPPLLTKRSPAENGKKDSKMKQIMEESASSKYKTYRNKLKFFGRRHDEPLPPYARYNNLGLFREGVISEDAAYFTSDKKETGKSDALTIATTISSDSVNGKMRKAELSRIYHDRSADKLHFLGLPPKVDMPKEVVHMRLEAMMKKVNESGGPREFFGSERYDQLLMSSAEKRDELRRDHRKKMKLLEQHFGRESITSDMRSKTLGEVEALTGLRAKPSNPRRPPPRRFPNVDVLGEDGGDAGQGMAVHKSSRKMKAMMEETNVKRKSGLRKETHDEGAASSSRVRTSSKDLQKGRTSRNWFDELVNGE